MVKIVSKDSELRKINDVFSKLESKTKEIFPNCEIRGIPLSWPANSPFSNYTRVVYTQGVTSIGLDSYQANEVIIDMIARPSLTIVDRRAYDDAFRLAQAYEDLLGEEFFLNIP